MHTREKGTKGESIACKFLQNKGFTIVARNYQKKWGEIDIIAQKDHVLQFVEVKSVTFMQESGFTDSYRPEDNVHPYKIRHIGRMIETYLGEMGCGVDQQFCFHVICVYMNMNTRKASVKWIKDIIL